jgi:phosphate/sulfate permease
VIVVMMWVMLTFDPIPGASTTWYQNLLAGVFVVVFGFLFVTVASRISGLLGNSSNPVSGMSIATLMATCAIFLVRLDRAEPTPSSRSTIGGVVCVAAAIAGGTSPGPEDRLPVGRHTIPNSRVALIIGSIGVTVYFAIGGTLLLMNTRPAQRTSPCVIRV